MKDGNLRDLTHEEFSTAIQRKGSYVFEQALDTPSEEDKAAGVNDFLKEDGYFGIWMVIKFKGKYSMLMFSRLCDSGCTSTKYWYDKIFYGIDGNYWSADYRWNSDKPLIAMVGSKYQLLAPHSAEPMLKTPVDSISTKWTYNKKLGYYLSAKLDDKDCLVLQTGQIIYSAKAMEEKLKKWKEVFDADIIEKEWVEKGGKCVYTHGLWNGGAGGGRLLSEEEAKKNNRCYHFSNGFYVKMWTFSARYGDVVLEFNERSASDME